MKKYIVELMKASVMVTGISFAFPMAAMLPDVRKSLIALFTVEWKPLQKKG